MPGLLWRRREQILQMIRDHGYHVSVFDNLGSLWGTVKAFVEMHAIDLSDDPPVRFVSG